MKKTNLMFIMIIMIFLVYSNILSSTPKNPKYETSGLKNLDKGFKLLPA